MNGLQYLPDDPVVWVAGIIALLAFLLVAVWKGDLLLIETRPFRVSFRGGRDRADRGGTRVSVGDRMTIRNSETGDIVGISGSPGGRDGQPPPESVAAGMDVSVARKAAIGGSTVGDISGVRASAGGRRAGGTGQRVPNGEAGAQSRR